MNYHGWSLLLELYPVSLWPIGVIFFLVLVCFITFRLLRKKGSKIAKDLHEIFQVRKKQAIQPTYSLSRETD